MSRQGFHVVLYPDDLRERFFSGQYAYCPRKGCYSSWQHTYGHWVAHSLPPTRWNRWERHVMRLVKAHDQERRHDQPPGAGKMHAAYRLRARRR